MARPLFGGALTANIPSNSQDVSELREIPDNQEVFAHRSTDQSLIVELLEYQSQVDNEDAARYHFEDVAGSNKASGPGTSEVHSVHSLPKEGVKLQHCTSAWLLQGAQMVSKFNEEARNTVNIHMGLFRLPHFSTDILVTFNDPVSISPLSSSSSVSSVTPTAQEVEPWTEQDFMCVLQSLQLLDPVSCSSQLYATRAALIPHACWKEEEPIEKGDFENK